MNIERDKYYKTRDGSRVRVICVDASFTAPILGISDYGSAIKYLSNGTTAYSSSDHPYDIVAPWIDKPEVEWSALPAWYNYVFQSPLGSWFSSKTEPSKNYGGWSIMGDYISIPTAYAPKWTGDWKDSLVTREVAK